MSLKQMKQQFLIASQEEERKGGGEGNHGNSSSTPTTTTTTTVVTNASAAVDSETALKNFLDSIPISSIPHIKNNKFRGNVLFLNALFSNFRLHCI